MRIWDISPGYLNDRSLLGEHRELHGIVSILTHGKKGYSHHPETLRWAGCLKALAVRHLQLSCEMQLRGFNDRSPVPVSGYDVSWPDTYIDEPAVQYEILAEKYVGKEPGRIGLPRNIQELWSHHKYSMLARDQHRYREIGRQVADNRIEFAELATLLVVMLRSCPSEGDGRNAVQHMWGYVSGADFAEDDGGDRRTVPGLLSETTRRAVEICEPYLLSSTALVELSVWFRSV